MTREADESLTITNQEIMHRLNLKSQETLHRWEKKRGLPGQSRTGREGVRSRAEYLRWEKEHYPLLHPKPERPEDEDTIELMRQGAKLTQDFVIRIEPRRKPKPRKKK